LTIDAAVDDGAGADASGAVAIVEGAGAAVSLLRPQAGSSVMAARTGTSTRIGLMGSTYGRIGPIVTTAMLPSTSARPVSPLTMVTVLEGITDMFIADVIVAALLSFALLGSGAAKLTRQPKIVESLTGLGVPASWLPLLAGAEIAGAAGLLIGLGVAGLGIAAAIGVVLYFVGATTAHLRKGDHEIAPTVVLGLLAVAAIILRAASI